MGFLAKLYDSTKPKFLSSLGLREYLSHCFFYILGHVLVFQYLVQILLINRQPIGIDFVKPFDVFVTDSFNKPATIFHAAILQLFGETDIPGRTPVDQFSISVGNPKYNIF